MASPHTTILNSISEPANNMTASIPMVTSNTAVITGVNYTGTQVTAVPTTAIPTVVKQEPEQIKVSAAPVPTVVPSISLSQSPASALRQAPTGENKVLDKRRLQDLVKEVDPLEQLDDDVEEILMQIADDFIDNVAMAACQLAKHRKSNIVEVKDVQLHLERNWNMLIPGFGSDELRPYKKAATTDAHKQRLALIKKTQKKY